MTDTQPNSTEQPTRPFGDDNAPGPGFSGEPSSQRELGGKLAGLSIPKQVLVLAIWPFMEHLLGFMVGFVDLFLAGRMKSAAAGNALAENAINALTPAAYLTWFLNITQGMVAVGAAALVSRAIGARHKRMANGAVGQAFLMALCTSTAVGLMMLCFADWFIHLTLPNLNSQTHQFTVQYLRIMAAALPFSGVLMTGNACLRASGDTRAPFKAMVVVNIVNMAASWLFVFGPEPVGGHMVKGLAMGSVCGWIVGATLIGRKLLRERNEVRLYLHRLRPQWAMMKRVLRISIPGGMETMGLWVIHFTMISWINGLPEDRMGAHGLGTRLEGLSYMPGWAMAAAASTLVGQYLGLGDPTRARKAANFCWMCGVIIMSVCGLAFFFIPGPITSLVTDNPKFHRFVPTILQFCAFFQPAFASMMVMSGAIRGAGDTRYTLFSTWTTTIGVRLLGVYYVRQVLDADLMAVWVIMNLDIYFRAILLFLRYRGDGWLKTKV